MTIAKKIGRKVPVAVYACVSLIAFAGQGSAMDEAAQVALGQTEYMAQCASCHGPRGKGDGPVAQVLVNKPPDLTAISARYSGQFPADEIQAIVDGRNMVNPHGDRGMPIWGDRYFAVGMEKSKSVPHDVDAQALAFGRVAALVKFLESIQAE
ncbi:c-type cytochrome [Leisingera caerulea]|uniref:c-type cytochrome n=1 Tax=Leisingera caerulea TaxID=506591 RepID=UPI0021A947B3|nr:cytochrome c [Leisingera caerulea]UWQ84715.1 cytochrome c [Leisingera caerulea]